LVVLKKLRETKQQVTRIFEGTKSFGNSILKHQKASIMSNTQFEKKMYLLLFKKANQSYNYSA
jgi:hypothetical protein